MAALLHHRKLMFSDDGAITEEPCARPCSYPTSYHDTIICPTECFDVCPSICGGHINPPPNVDPNPNALYVVVFLPVIMTTVLVCGCLSIYRWTAGQSQPPPQLAGARWHVRAPGGLRSSVIDAIAIRRYRKGEGAVEGSECPVCLSEFREDEILRVLPNCKHAFHVACVDAWLKSHANCPVCRAGVEGSENSDVAPPVLALNGGYGGIPVSNGREREGSEAHQELGSPVNEKEDESTEQNIVPKNNNIVEHS
ncbi:PREDICTED: RING-H2 finger protein ATL54-like [Ipomoea nil]|uniref:RING-H2 finger protein ATL54-like n=1 Tax=Ipomoea nil TaxID=35883 RepID=UPI0009016DBF|nr:PREDICTED: RING-H2 finger protein ATL54-like [Ipomoea nil]